MLPNLKLLRKEYGISQQRLADAIGLSQPSPHNSENHNIEPEIEVLIRIADFFNTSVDYLIGHTEVRRKIEHVEEYSLNKPEIEMITRYRSLTEDEKQCIDLTVRTFLKK